MGSLPRWINDSTVDSQAMLGAFLRARALAPPEELAPLNSLWAVCHRSCTDDTPGITPVPMGLPERRCHAPACRRCIQGQGGYQFRWFDARWYGDYYQFRRHGAWGPFPPAPNQPPADTTPPMTES